MPGYIDASTLSLRMPQRLEITASSVPNLDTAQMICDEIGESDRARFREVAARDAVWSRRLAAL